MLRYDYTKRSNEIARFLEPSCHATKRPQPSLGGAHLEERCGLGQSAQLSFQPVASTNCQLCE